ncbi:MAG: class II aldolase/adducin family protein [Actinomycetota bacterium]|nr:MAG: class II aldolase/adducin family protein [Actinomycetota bacterium]
MSNGAALEFRAEREKIALACRIMAMEGIVEATLGHISMRVGKDLMLIRSRGPEDSGLFFATPEEICLFDFSGNRKEADRGFAKPVELPLHGETLRNRPDANVVLHAHPPAVLLAALSGLDLLPSFGAFNIPAALLAADGIPVFPRSVLISSIEVAQDMLASLGDHKACVLKGHGITVIGESVEQTLIRALNLNTIAGIALEVAQAGGRTEAVPEEDLAALPDLGSNFNDVGGWRYYLAKLRRAGFDKW